MADDKSKRGGSDRARVAANEPYEVGYFARKHGMSRDEARALIDRIGNDRAALNAAAAERSAATVATSRPTRKLHNEPKPIGAVVEAVAGAIVEPVGAIVAPAGAIVAPITRRAAAVRGRAAETTREAVTTMRRAPAKVQRRSVQLAGKARSVASGRAVSLVGVAAAGLTAGLMLNLGRKLAVQAPSTLAGDWLEAVKLEHRLALTLFDQLQATTDAETAKRSALLTQLKHALGKHAFMEENVLYPALRGSGDTNEADKLNHDHGYVKQYLYDLEQIDNASPAYLAKVNEFRAQIEEHIREEEEVIFPPLHAALGESGNARVTGLANKEALKLA